MVTIGDVLDTIRMIESDERELQDLEKEKRLRDDGAWTGDLDQMIKDVKWRIHHYRNREINEQT